MNLTRGNTPCSPPFLPKEASSRTERKNEREISPALFFCFFYLPRTTLRSRVEHVESRVPTPYTSQKQVIAHAGGDSVVLKYAEALGKVAHPHIKVRVFLALFCTKGRRPTGVSNLFCSSQRKIQNIPSLCFCFALLDNGSTAREGSHGNQVTYRQSESREKATKSGDGALKQKKTQALASLFFLCRRSTLFFVFLLSVRGSERPRAFLFFSSSFFFHLLIFKKKPPLFKLSREKEKKNATMPPRLNRKRFVSPLLVTALLLLVVFVGSAAAQQQQQQQARTTTMTTTAPVPLTPEQRARLAAAARESALAAASPPPPPAPKKEWATDVKDNSLDATPQQQRLEQQLV